MNFKLFIFQLIILISITCLFVLFAKGQKVNFSNESLEQLAEEAKMENKPIFIDVYTDYCEPCKFADKYIFTTSSIADSMNKYFINYKLNAEKGEGIPFAKNYQIHTYPTFLFINKSGRLFFRFTGAPGDSSGFLKLIFDPAFKEWHKKKPVYEWYKEYAEGNRDINFLEQYILKREKVGLSNGSLLDTLLKKMPEDSLFTLRTLRYVQSFGDNINSMAARLWLRDSSKVLAVIHPGDCLQKKEFWYYTYINNLIRKSLARLNNDKINSTTKMIPYQEADMYENNTHSINQLLTTIRKIYPKKFPVTSISWENIFYIPAGEGISKLSASYFQSADDKKLALKYTDQYVTHYLLQRNKNWLQQQDSIFTSEMVESCNCANDSLARIKCMDNIAAHNKHIISSYYADELNNAADYFLNNSYKKESLTDALSWSSKSLQIDSTFYALETYAGLLYKLGNSKLALSTDLSALQMARQQHASAYYISNLRKEIDSIKVKINYN